MKFVKCITETKFENKDGEVIEFVAQCKKKSKVKADKHGFYYDGEYPSMVVVEGKQMLHPIYRIWNNMETRATSAKYQERCPTYAGVSVCQEWKLYSNFAEWVMMQFDWLSRELDKDLMIAGNKRYSSETCRFVPHAINLLLTDGGNTRGDLPLGVSINKGRGYLQSRCLVNGQRIAATFGTNHPREDTGEMVKLAHRFWQQSKIRAIRSAIAKNLVLLLDSDIIEALELGIEQLEQDIKHNNITTKL